jgi:hypothetical protein
MGDEQHVHIQFIWACAATLPVRDRELQPGALLVGSMFGESLALLADDFTAASNANKLARQAIKV